MGAVFKAPHFAIWPITVWLKLEFFMLRLSFAFGFLRKTDIKQYWDVDWWICTSFVYMHIRNTIQTYSINIINIWFSPQEFFKWQYLKLDMRVCVISWLCICVYLSDSAGWLQRADKVLISSDMHWIKHA